MDAGRIVETPTGDPEFPDYEVADSATVDMVAAAEARKVLGYRGTGTVEVLDGQGRVKRIPVNVDALTDEQAVELAALVRRAQLSRCAVHGCKRPAAFTARDDDKEFGLCARHGKRVYALHNGPKMAVPRGRRKR